MNFERAMNMSRLKQINKLITTFLVAIIINPLSVSAQTEVYTFLSSSNTGALGWSLKPAGDVNGDGIVDIIAGDPEDSTSIGEAKVFSGANGSELYSFNGQSGNDLFGWSVNGGRDVNNDGYDDIIVGAYQNDAVATDSGNVKVYSGFDGSQLISINGDSADTYFGYSVALIEDLNGDSKDELLCGAIQDTVRPGTVYIRSGADGTAINSVTGEFAGEDFATSVEEIGDVNDDGISDFIVGTVGGNAHGALTGRATIFSGADRSELFNFDGENGNDRFGTSVSGAGDVNADGTPDVIVGAIFEDTNGSNAGAAYVYSGSNGSLLYTFYGDSANDNFGYSVSGAGDIDKDGYADLIVGAHFDDNSASDAGSARIFSGRDGSAIVTINGQGAGDRFGFSVSGLGDVTNDGYPEIMVGAPEEDLNGKRGVVRVYSFEGFDFCPNDNNKTLPGDCGCGTEDVDENNNQVSDCLSDDTPAQNLVKKIKKFNTKIKKAKKSGNSKLIKKLKKKRKDAKDDLKEIQDRHS